MLNVKMKNKSFSYLTVIICTAVCWTRSCRCGPRGWGWSIGLTAVTNAHTVYLNHTLYDQVKTDAQTHGTVSIGATLDLESK